MSSSHLCEKVHSWRLTVDLGGKRIKIIIMIIKSIHSFLLALFLCSFVLFCSCRYHAELLLRTLDHALAPDFFLSRRERVLALVESLLVKNKTLIRIISCLEHSVWRFIVISSKI